MAAKVVAGSVPMATATSSREPFNLPSEICGIPPIAPSGMLTAPPADSAIIATRALDALSVGSASAPAEAALRSASR